MRMTPEERYAFDQLMGWLSIWTGGHRDPHRLCTSPRCARCQAGDLYEDLRAAQSRAAMQEAAGR